MAITIGSLRSFCAEIASPDSAGDTADREFMLWINAAIARLYSELGWDQILHERKVTVVPAESGSNLAVTQGSTSVTLGGGEVFLDKYVTDEWEFYVEGDSSSYFVLESIDNAPDTAGTFRDGDEWIEATDAAAAWTAVQTKYTLPDNAKQIQRAQVLGIGDQLVILSPDEFDLQRSMNPTQTGSYPRFACLRENRLEIWPHPGSDYVKIGLSYRKGPPTYADAADDADEVDWSNEWRDLLHKAILLEAAITQGEGSPINYAVLTREYEDRLNRYKGLSANKANLSGPLDVRVPQATKNDPPRSFTWIGTLTDVP